MKTTLVSTLLFFFLLVLTCPSQAKVIHIPKDYDTIQRAIDASSRNDVIRVAAGTYYENITLKEGRSLVGDGAEFTFIIDDGKGPPNPVVSVDGDALFQGFTVTGGRGAGVGHAVMVSRGSPRILDNIIRDNSYTGLGLHSEVYYTAPIIVGNKLFGNGGAGIANLGRYCKPVIRKNEIFNNTNVGIACTDHTQPLILENNIHDNGAGIAAKDEADVEIIKNLIVGNKLVGINISKKARGTIRNNNIMTNGSTGINIDKSPMTIMEENTVVDNGAEGVFVKNESVVTINNNIIAGNLPTVFQVHKSSAIMTRNQIYSHEEGNINASAVRFQQAKIISAGNEIVGGVSKEDNTEFTELEIDNPVLIPPSRIPSEMGKSESSEDVSGSPTAEHSEEEGPSETAPVTGPKPVESEGCLFFF